MLHFFISLLNRLLSLIRVRLHFRFGHVSIQGSIVVIGLLVDIVELDISICISSPLQTSFSDKCSSHFSKLLLQLFLNCPSRRVSILLANRRHRFDGHLSIQSFGRVDVIVGFIVVTGSTVSELASVVSELKEVEPIFEVASDVIGVDSESI